MIRYSRLCIAIAILGAGLWMSPASYGQQVFQGSTSPDAVYPAPRGIDLNGRASIVDVGSIEQLGRDNRWYGRRSPQLVVPDHWASGRYYGSGARNGYPVVVGGPSVGSVVTPGGIETPTGTRTLSPPRTVLVGGIYPSRTVFNNATPGTVIEYTHNGTGTISTPGSSYQTVVASGPSIFPSTTVIQSSEQPVVIQSRPIRPATTAVSKRFPGKTAPVRPASDVPEIQLLLLNESSSPLSYVLNGTVYSIKPGYSHTFPDDRRWIIEVAHGQQVARYELHAGTYQFLQDATGWDLKQNPSPPTQLPPPPVPLESTIPVPAPTPSPDR